MELRLRGNFLRPEYPYKKQNCNYLTNYIRKNVTALYAAGKGGEGWDGERDRGGGKGEGKRGGQEEGGDGRNIAQVKGCLAHA